MKGKNTKVFIFLSLMFIGTFTALLTYSCKIQEVGPIEPINVVIPEPEPETFLIGTVINGKTGAALAGVDIKLNGVTVQTDAAGEFTFETRLAVGDYTISASLTDFIKVFKTLAVDTDDPQETFSISFALTPVAPVVVVDATAGGEVTAEDSTSITIPAGALPVTTGISVTPVSGDAGSPVDATGVTTTGNETTNAYSLEPHGTTFQQPVTIKVKRTMPVSVVQNVGVNVDIYDPINEVWEDLGQATLSTDQNWLEVQVTHFSYLVLSTDLFDFSSTYKTLSSGSASVDCGDFGTITATASEVCIDVVWVDQTLTDSYKNTIKGYISQERGITITNGTGCMSKAYTFEKPQSAKDDYYVTIGAYVKGYEYEVKWAGTNNVVARIIVPTRKSTTFSDGTCTIHQGG